MANIEKYLPTRFYSIKEFYDYCIAWNPEFDKIYQDQAKWRKNVFPDQADIDGIRLWEKVFGITPESSATLEDRRFKILTELQKRTPYTWNQLHKMLDALCGEGHYELKKGYFTLMLYLSMDTQSKLKSVMNMLQDIVPMHILIDVTQLLYYNFNIDVLSYTNNTASLTILPYQARNTTAEVKGITAAAQTQNGHLTILPYQERATTTAACYQSCSGAYINANLVINIRS